MKISLIKIFIVYLQYKVRNAWAIGQTVKMSACHAVRSEFNSRIARCKNTSGEVIYNILI